MLPMKMQNTSSMKDVFGFYQDLLPPPRPPTFATFSNEDTIAEDDEEDDINLARQLKEDWEVLWDGEDEDEDVLEWKG